ncbi:MAG: hypothetical protein ABSC57_05325 [Syntrophales bacterium]
MKTLTHVRHGTLEERGYDRRVLGQCNIHETDWNGPIECREDKE